MADIKEQRYKDPRPAEHFAHFHEWTRTHEPGWTYELVRLITGLVSMTFYRARAIGTENVPASGPVIFAPNHFSNMDHFFCGVYLRRKIQFMAKSQLFGNAVGDYIFRVGGVFPIRRGYRDAEAFKTAHAILERGGTVLIYAEGGRSRSGELGEPKAGVGRLALESGAPVVSVAIHGSLGVHQWRRLRFPKVTVQFGEPLSFDPVDDPDREAQQRASEEIFARVKPMYRALQEKGRGAVIKELREGRYS